MLNKITAKKKLENLIEKYQNNRAEIRNKANKYTEADARREYIDPFLEIFGWDIVTTPLKTFMGFSVH